MTTLRDVAQRAGVSAMTVSNVVNGRTGKVSAATLERVRAVIDELGYIPNAQARALAGASSRLVALVYGTGPDRERGPLLVSHESVFVGACERACQERGLALMLCAAEDGEAAADALVARLRAWRVDGVIALGTLPERSRARLARLGPVMVEVDHMASVQHTGSRVVVIDDVDGGRQAGARLREAGHRRVVMVGPDASLLRIEADRLAGLCESLGAPLPVAVPGSGAEGDDEGGTTAPVSHEDGVVDARVRYVESGQSHADGLAVGRALAEDLASGCEETAVFASGDVLAMGIVAGLVRSGVEVPGRVSVVGMDGFEVSRYCEPPLSTVSQPVDRKAAEAVALLVAALEEAGDAGSDAGAAPAQVVTLPVSWREGGTLGPVPAARPS